MTKLFRAAAGLLLCVALILAQPARATDIVIGRPCRLDRPDPLADPYRHQEGLLRRGQHQARPGLHPVERGGAPAACRGLARHGAVGRTDRSDQCHRQRCPDLDRAVGNAACAVCDQCQVAAQEIRGPQGQDRHGRRSQGHHQDVPRSHAGRAQHEAERCRSCFRGLDRGALPGVAIGRDRRDRPAAAVQLRCRGRGLQQSRSGCGLSPETCRSPAVR